MQGFKPKDKDKGQRSDANGPGLGFHPGRWQTPQKVLDGPGLGFHPGLRQAMQQPSDAAAKGSGPGFGFHPGRRQASDSIPAMVAPGEFILPPDTVHAMGGKEALQSVVDATHTPAPVNADVPMGFHPQLFFANGGAPEDQPQKNSFGDAAAAASNPGVTQVQTAAPPAPKPVQESAPASAQPAGAQMATPPSGPAEKPVSPTNTFPQASPSAGASVPGGIGGLPGRQPTKPNSFGDAAAAAADPSVTQSTQPKAPPIAPVAQPDPMAAHNQKLEAARGLQSWRQAQSASASTAGSPAARENYLGLQQKAVDLQPSYFTQEGPTAAKNRAAAESAASGALQSMYAPQKPADASAANPYANVTPEQARAMAEINAKAQVPEVAAPSAAAQVMPGVYQHGKGQYSDQATGMGFPAGFTGKPNTQNMAAAESLSGGFRPRSAGDSAPAQPGLGFHPGMTAPQVQHSGNSWQARMNLRNARVSANSITNNGGRWDQHKGVSPERAYAAAMENADFAARGAQAGMAQAAMRENAAIQREGMQQAGATERAGFGFRTAQQRAAIEGQRAAIEGRRADSEITALGFKTRAALQQEQLRNALVDPNTTPEQKTQAAATLRALSGEGDKWKSVALQGGTDALGNKTESMLGAVNERTGEMKRMEVRQAGLRAQTLRANP